MEGWIKLHRQLKDHWIWKSERRLKWWIDILFSVNHMDSTVLVKGTLVECKRGQSIRSLDTWARDWNISKGAVRDFFRLLQTDQMLTTESLQFTTRITVCKYEDYQTELNAKKTLKKRTENGEETLCIPKQECKEEKELKNIPIFEDFKNYALENQNNTDLKALELKYKAWVENGWKDGNNKKIINWKSKLLNTLQYISKNANTKSSYEDEPFDNSRFKKHE